MAERPTCMVMVLEAHIAHVHYQLRLPKRHVHIYMFLCRSSFAFVVSNAVVCFIINDHIVNVEVIADVHGSIRCEV